MGKKNVEKRRSRLNAYQDYHLNSLVDELGNGSCIRISEPFCSSSLSMTMMPTAGMFLSTG